MNYGLCPNCLNKLTDESALMTQPSSIFKGNNVYLMCKNCQQVLLYNMNRDLIFELDDYKEDEAVIAEINKLLSEVDNHYEVPSSANCSGNCAACQGCAVEPEPDYQRKARKTPVPPIEPVEEESKEDVKAIIETTLSNSILAVNKKDPTTKMILPNVNDLDDMDIDEWVFFEMNPIEIQVEIKKTYNIIRR